MEFIKRSWQQIILQLEQLSANAKWLIGLVLIVMVLSLVLILQYAGRPEYVVVTGFASDSHTQVQAQLRSAGISIDSKGGQLRVPADQYIDALATLARADLMAPDASVAYDQLLMNTSIWVPNSQYKTNKLIAKMKVLGRIINAFKGVHSATVVIDAPEEVGFGVTHTLPSATVSTVMKGGAKLNQKMAETIAGVVSGAVAKMTPQQVTVVDASTGTQYTVKDEEEYGPQESLVIIKEREQHYHDKIAGLFRYINGFIVAVNIQIEPIRRKNIHETKYLAEEPLERTETVRKIREDNRQFGEPGTRANTRAQIPGSVVPSSSEQEEIERNDYGSKPIIEQVHTNLVGQTTKQINVSVNVPRSYLLTLWSQAGPDQGDAQVAGGPDNAFIQLELDKITRMIQPIIKLDEPGDLNVDMYDDGPIQLATAQHKLQMAGIGGVFASQWIRPVGLGILSLIAVAMMVFMVRQATRETELPTAEELVGIPPTLTIDDELIGEVEESDPSMPGFEVGEEDIRSRKIAEQISELVKANPDEAVNLVSKWVQTGD